MISSRFLLVIVLAGLGASAARAEQDAFEFFREEAQISIASRRKEAAREAPAAVDVVTAEEIRAYGYQSLADILRFRPGMDVIDGRSGDGNRAIVSARGFSRDFVAEMQVFVDGRSVYSPMLGGVYWASMPIQIQDIERIEIVRGPNAALFGSNAALGVINIVTRKPGAGAAGAVSARAGSRSLGSSESAEAGSPLGGVRVSHAFDEASARPAPDGVGHANDYFHSNKLNLRARLAAGPSTEVEFMGGGSWETLGVPGFPSDLHGTMRDEFEMLRAERVLDGDGAIEAMISHSEQNTALDNFLSRPGDLRVYQYDAEILHRSGWADGRAHSVVGGGWRLSGVFSDQLFTGRASQKNEITRGFTHHSFALTDAVKVVAGLSVEDSRVGGLQPAWQGAAVWSPRESDRLRVSYSHAPTMPALFNKYGDFTLSPAARFIGNAGLGPQQLTSWETGWTGRALDGALKSEVTLYIMEIRDRIFQRVDSAGPPRVLAYDTRNRASARGVELSEEYVLAPGRAVFANYTFERILDDKGVDAAGTDLRRGTPMHKANFGARARLGRGFAAAALLGYKDAYEANSTTRGMRRPVARSFRADARLSWAPRRDWELFLSVMDFLQPYRVETADGTASPRRFEAGMTKRFGL